MNTTTITTNPASLSLPNLLLRVEGAALFAAGIVIFAQQGGAWWVFALLLLTPDLAMLPYLFSPRAGAISYNIIHTIALPLLFLLIGAGAESSAIVQAAAIWLSHIGMDRVVGYGLKYVSGFKDTHMQRV